jgi:RND family efflux transporter MFP subunit
MFAKTGSIILKVAVILVLVAGAVFAAIFGLREPVFVREVKLGLAVHAISGSVTVFADKDLQELKSEVAGRVVWTSPLLDGTESFRRGDELVRLDARELERRIARAKSDYEAAVKQREILRENNPARLVAVQNLENALRVQKRGGDVSDDQINGLRRALNQIETELKIADLQDAKAEEDFRSEQEALNDLLEKMTIRATADGVTQGVMVAEGSLINAGATVATFYRNERVVVAKIGEEDFGHIRLGQSAKVRLLIYGDKEFDATVSKILPYAESQTQLYTVHLEVDLDPGKLLPNSTGEATIEVGRRENQPLVPRRAVINNDYVLVVNNGRVERRQVELGYIGLNLAEIRKGLKPGELVIVENLEQFRAGQRVTVAHAS